MGSQRKYTTYLLNGKLRAYCTGATKARSHVRSPFYSRGARTRAVNNGQDAALVAPGPVLAE